MAPPSIRAASRARNPLIGICACTRSGRSSRITARNARNATQFARGDRLRVNFTGRIANPSPRATSSNGPSAETPTTSCPRARNPRINGKKKCRS
jgi:hypothetical protein